MTMMLVGLAAVIPTPIIALYRAANSLEKQSFAQPESLRPANTEAIQQQLHIFENSIKTVSITSAVLEASKGLQQAFNMLFVRN